MRKASCFRPVEDGLFFWEINDRLVQPLDDQFSCQVEPKQLIDMFWGSLQRPSSQLENQLSDQLREDFRHEKSKRKKSTRQAH